MSRIRGSSPIHAALRRARLLQRCRVVNVKPLAALACARVFMGGECVARSSALIHHRLLDVMGNSFSIGSSLSLTSGRIHQLYYPIGNTHTRTCFIFCFFCYVFFSFNVCRRLAVVAQQGWSDPPADLLVLFMKGSGWIIYGVHGYLANVLLTLSSLSARGQFVLAQQGSGLELMSGYSNLCWRAQVGVRSLRFLQRARTRVCLQL